MALGATKFPLVAILDTSRVQPSATQLPLVAVITDVLEASTFLVLVQQCIDSARSRGGGGGGGGGGLLTSTRAEALGLYRSVLRASRLFVWRDHHGNEWGEVIRSSTRREFEAARHERDPEMVSRLIVVGRDALQKTLDKFLEKHHEMATGAEGGPGGAGAGGGAAGGNLQR